MQHQMIDHHQQQLYQQIQQMNLQQQQQQQQQQQTQQQVAASSSTSTSISTLPLAVEPQTMSDAFAAPSTVDLAAANLKTRLQVKISCSELLNRDTGSMSDPQVWIFIQHISESSRVRLRRANSVSSTHSTDSVVEMRLVGSDTPDIVGGWKLHSKSSVLKDCLSPVFPDVFHFDYYFEEVQNLCFVVVDSDSNKAATYLDEHDYLGHATVSIAQLASTGERGHTVKLIINDELLHRGIPRFGKKGKKMSTSTSTISFVTSSEADSRKNVVLNILCRKLDRKDSNGSSDPYFVISRIMGANNKSDKSPRLLPVFRSPVVKRNINPTWNNLRMPLKTLTPSGTQNEPLRVAIYDWDEKGGDDFIGHFDTTLESLLRSHSWPIINPRKAKGLGSLFYKNSGTFSTISGSIIDEPTFVDYVMAGTKINLAVAIDLTASNQFPYHPTSLHHCPEILRVNDGNGNLIPPPPSYFATAAPPNPMNEYQAAIAGVGKILQEYDSNKIFPLYGFGFEMGGVKQRCALFGDCNGVNGLLSTYKSVICNPQVRLSGPTDFAPVIRQASARLRLEMKETPVIYHILLMITDGLITDLNATLEALVDASTLPMSIVIVGVGWEDFGMMKLLDADDDGGWRHLPGGKTARDIVQFVSMREVQGNPFALARETLAEIPRQFLDYARSHNWTC